MLAAMLRYDGLHVRTSDALGQVMEEPRAGHDRVQPVVLYLVVNGGDSLLSETTDAAVKSVVARFKARIRKGTVVEVAVKADT
jgi:hypothetical protein